MALARARAFEARVSPPKNPWSWVTEARVTYALKILLLVVVALYLGGIVVAFLVRISTVVYILIGAVFFAYLIYPFVERLHRRMPIWLALAVVYIGLLLVIAGAGWLVIPGLMNDIGNLAHNYPKISANIQSLVNNPNDPLLARLPEPVRVQAIKLPEEIVAWAQIHGVEAAGHALSIFVGTIAAVATFIIIPLLAAYLLVDVQRLRSSVLEMIPASRWGTALAILGDVDGVIGGFIRGQLIVAACVGVLLTIALLILHVPYAFLLGLLAAVGDLVPYVGAVVTFVPAVLVALVSNGLINAAIVAVAFVAIYELEGHVISPTIVSSQVKLTPLMVMVAVLIGAELGGILGMLVAVPVAGVIRVLVVRMLRNRAQAPATAGSNEKRP